MDAFLHGRDLWLSTQHLMSHFLLILKVASGAVFREGAAP